MTKHTPGPWTAILDSEGLWVSPPNHDDPVICDLVARVSQMEEDTGLFEDVFQDEDIANANLIAAAPDLLKACQIMADACNSYNIEVLVPEYENMMEAIAKATGKEAQP